jgi:hypothetical protein
VSSSYKEEARAYKEAYFKLIENVASMKAFEPTPPIFLSTPPAAQPVQEPVGHRVGFWCADLTCNKCYIAEFRFKHTTPQQRPWVGLTQQEENEIWKSSRGVQETITKTQAKLKEKNT